jgi:phosphoribosylformylglycinamidine synthase PurS subunit
MYSAVINIMPLKELLDPQGKAVEHGLKNMSFTGFSNVRIGKVITIQVEAASETEAKEKVELACKKLLANPVMESYQYTVSKIG